MNITALKKSTEILNWILSEEVAPIIEELLKANLQADILDIIERNKEFVRYPSDDVQRLIAEYEKWYPPLMYEYQVWYGYGLRINGRLNIIAENEAKLFEQIPSHLNFEMAEFSNDVLSLTIQNKRLIYPDASVDEDEDEDEDEA